MNRDPYLEHRILSADPIELIQILYRHALDMVRDARLFLRNGDIRARSKAICRAIGALSELEGSLDHASGGEISRNLAALYQYMRRRLTTGNMNQLDQPLAEVESLLTTLAEAWNTLRRTPSTQYEPPQEPEPKDVRGPFMTDTSFEFASHRWSA